MECNQQAPVLINQRFIHAPLDLCLRSESEPNEKIYVHKIVLMCISPYFQKVIEYRTICKKNALICSNPLLSSKNDWPYYCCNNTEMEEIYIHAASTDLIKFIVNYAYTGQANLNDDNVFDLIILSDMYNITCLENECIKYLLNKLNANNCIGIYLFADKFNCFQLHQKTLKFLLRNFVSVSRTSNEFTSLLSIEMIEDLLKQHCLYVEDEYQVFESIVRWINYDEKKRIFYFGKLINSVRLALISEEKLSKIIANHPFVLNDQKAKILVTNILQIKHHLLMAGKPDMHLVKDQCIRNHLTPRYPLEFIFVFGGRILDTEFTKPESSVEVYDYRAERWRQIAFAQDNQGGRDHHQCIFVNKQIYIIGGHSGPFTVFNSCRKFCLKSKTWQEIAPMKEKRAFLACVLLNNQIYAIGGFNGSWRVNTVEKYDIASNNWINLPKMNERRSGAGASVLNNNIYVVGGFRDLVYLSSVELFSVESNQWSTICEMNHPRSSPCAVTLDGFIYVIGGLGADGLLSSAERYDCDTKKWIMLEQEMSEKKCSSAAVALGNKIFVIGGWNGTSGIASVELWCSVSKKWYLGSRLIHRRTGCSACLIKDMDDIENYAWLDRHLLIKERYLNSLKID